MFGWLTRNDGRRGAQAARRLASPRASVFAEFALVMPVVMLVCSALIEITGYWDAQVMANHAAWTVGRIAMVRGSDGLAFSGSLNEKSKTGVTNTNMPASIQNFLDDLTKDLRAANKFNNRGTIATLFLMSTCGIGYYGGNPTKDLPEAFDNIVDKAVAAVVEGIPDLVSETFTKIELPDFFPGGSAILDPIKEAIEEFVRQVFEELFRPILEMLAQLLKDLVDFILKQIGEFVSGDLYLRQVYGGAVRIVRANETTGKEVLTVDDMDSTNHLSFNNPFIFSKAAGGRLAYPQVADTETKSDGFFVTGAHGWPANDNVLAMTQVEVNWPYEYGWLFPVVSGGTGTSNGPVATGHSMVFPQPSIMNNNLYSEGATAYEPGPTNNPYSPLNELADEMKTYLRTVKFSMLYRIRSETLTLIDSDPDPAHGGTLKYLKELREAFGITENVEGEGDYAECWNRLTEGKDQHAWMIHLEGYFATNQPYHDLEYFYWDGSLHNRYGKNIVDQNGQTDFATWYKLHPGLRFDGDSVHYDPGKGTFEAQYQDCLSSKSLSDKEKQNLQSVKPDVLYSNFLSFAGSYGGQVNVPHFVKWQGDNAGEWAKLDKQLMDYADSTEMLFDDIKLLLNKEIIEITQILEGGGTWSGSTEDPVFDPQDPITDPEEAAKRAREKWEELKDTLRGKLKEIDAAAVALRDQWEAYKSDIENFKEGRRRSVGYYFAYAYILTAAKTGNFNPSPSKFKFVSGAAPNNYSVVNGTKEMLNSVTAYANALANSLKLEKEYGEQLGLESAKPEKKQVRRGDWGFLETGEPVRSEAPPGKLTAGSDTDVIIDLDHQTFESGAWVWK